MKNSNSSKFYKNAFVVLHVSAILIYCLLVFSKLSDYPPYFFCDEAIHGVEAQSIISDGKDIHGRSFPAVFEGFGEYALSLTVYLQIPFVFLFGVSEFAVRLRTALVSIIGIWGVGLLIRTSRHPCQRSLPWLVFAVCPIWILHSRTGFEYVTAASFYLAFLGLYCASHEDESMLKSLGAGFFGACTFYSYTPARGWVAATVLLLLVLNARSHLSHWRRTCFFLLTLSICLVPYVVFHIQNPEAAIRRLTNLDMARPGQFTYLDRAAFIWDNYRTVFDPSFWFTLSGSLRSELDRHVIPGLSSIPLWFLPFCLAGILLALWQWRQIVNRTCLAALLATPFPAVLVAVNHERTIAFAAMLIVFSLMGLGGIAAALGRIPLAQKSLLFAAGLFLIIYGARLGFYMHQTAAKSYSNYGFYGLEYGARQLFDWIKVNHTKYDRINVTQGLFTQPEMVGRFFLPAEIHSKVGYPFFEKLCNSEIPSSSEQSMLWIISPAAHDGHVKSGCPVTLNTLHTFNCPNGAACFLAVQLSARPEFSEWMRKTHDAEAAKRKTRYSATIIVRNEAIRVEYPQLAGDADPATLFDGRDDAPIRTNEINPAEFRILIPAQSVHTIRVVLTNTTEAVVDVHTQAADMALHWGSIHYKRGKVDPSVIFQAPTRSATVEEIQVKISLPDWGPNGSPHLSEISWD